MRRGRQEVKVAAPVVERRRAVQVRPPVQAAWGCSRWVQEERASCRWHRGSSAPPRPCRAALLRISHRTTSQCGLRRALIPLRPTLPQRDLLPRLLRLELPRRPTLGNLGWHARLRLSMAPRKKGSGERAVDPGPLVPKSACNAEQSNWWLSFRGVHAPWRARTSRTRRPSKWKGERIHRQTEQRRG